MAESNQPATESAPNRKLASELHSVVVHASGALCRRRARAVLQSVGGVPLRVRVAGLPLTLDSYSLRGTVVSGPESLRVLDVRREVETDLPSAEDLTPLRQEHDAAEDAADAARTARTALATQVEHVAALRAVPPAPRRGDPPRPAPTDALLELADFVDTRLAELQVRLRAAEDEERAAEQRWDIARRRLQEASAALPTDRVRSSTTVVLTLDGSPPAAGTGAGVEVELEVEYRVPGATWTPVYQLRLEGIHGDEPGGSLAMRAMVAQRSGEDWTGVQLSLSTADLARGTELPELRSLRIGRRQAEPIGLLRRDPPSGLPELFTGYDAFVQAQPLGFLGYESRRGVFGAVAGGVVSEAFSAVSAGAGAEVGGGGGGGAGGGGGTPLPPSFVPSAPVPPGGRPVVRATYSSAQAPTPAPMQAPAPQPMARSVAPEASRRSKEAARDTAAPSLAAPAHYAPAAPYRAAPEPRPADRPLPDYAQLVLTAVDGFDARRGELTPGGSGFDPTASEMIMRAYEVSRLALPEHSVRLRVSAGSFDHRYDTAAPADVPSDGAWHTVPVLDVPVDLEPEHVCVPAVDPRVFAAVRLGNSSAHALLAGPAEVSVDGAYLMTVQLPTLAPGRHRRVGIGVVEGVQVARRTQMREASAGLRGGTTVLQHGIEIDLANRLGRPVTVEVRERVPVGEDKDIKVDELPSTPPWTVVPQEADEQQRRGMRIWRVTLEPHGNRRLSGGYEIRVPAAKALSEGNRRL